MVIWGKRLCNHDKAMKLWILALRLVAYTSKHCYQKTHNLISYKSVANRIIRRALHYNALPWCIRHEDKGTEISLVVFVNATSNTIGRGFLQVPHHFLIKNASFVATDSRKGKNIDRNIGINPRNHWIDWFRSYLYYDI